ncbi:MAG: thioredoxin [bacterium]|nr:thioredoxin [bacterium]
MTPNVKLLDFFASWCGPCRMMKPIIEEIEEEYKGKIALHKYDIDENQEEASKHNVMSIPTILILKDDKVINQLVGAQPKANIVEAINAAL